MTACHDPYRELELYLKEAEEEIGKAVEELQKHEATLCEYPPDVINFNHAQPSKCANLDVIDNAFSVVKDFAIVCQKFELKKDAVTQTTPSPLSRSSSFTWITECLSSSELQLSACSVSSEESLFFPSWEDHLTSISAPILRQSPPSTFQVPPRAHSAKELNELQAIEVCSWLRNAGFPQYAQMYEDNLFPIDLCIVQKDHTFLQQDSIKSIFRRLTILNKCAKMKYADAIPQKSICSDESDEEQCALSENWHFQQSNRRWSRISSVDHTADKSDILNSLKQSACKEQYLSAEELCRDDIEELHSNTESIHHSKEYDVVMMPVNQNSTYIAESSSSSGGISTLASEERIKRKEDGMMKKGAKSLLKRIDSLKSKSKTNTKKKPNENILFSSLTSCSDGFFGRSIMSLPHPIRSQQFRLGTLLHCDDESIWDFECYASFLSEKWKNTSKNDSNISNCITAEVSTLSNTLPLDKYSKNNERRRQFGIMADNNLLQVNTSEKKRGSFYENISGSLIVYNDIFIETMKKNMNNHDFGKNQCIYPLFPDCNGFQIKDNIAKSNGQRDSGIGSSLTRDISYHQAPWQCFLKCTSSTAKELSGPLHITHLTAPQILLLRKFSLLKLTTLMEKFSPCSRTGWNWDVTKLIRRIRSPHYKDKVVFGVPLLLILQRTGQPLPLSIQAAIHYLRETALDSTGLFRKSGVRSRIQKLKCLNESNPENISYDEQQAYDVADMLKQYFRELPEAIFTNKLSEIFIAIFKFVPNDLKLEAIHATIMLMPDENREVLQALLEFLQEVCQHSEINQMTATNLAMCFAPSLFHLNKMSRSSSSPRHKKTDGVPDQQELTDNRAAYECLSYMIKSCKLLFTVSKEIILQSHLSSIGYLEPPTLDELSNTVYNGKRGWRGYIDSCMKVLLKEAKEKYKGWENISHWGNIELAYKKLSDGYPLRLWKVSTEIEAPPIELLNRILRERHIWDNTFIKGKVVSHLSRDTELFQYVCSSLPSHPQCDYFILRSWKSDLPKGTCLLIESTINHSEAVVTEGSVRGIVLASRYLIEPCGSGKCRVTHISRIDTRGRSTEWYSRAYGHICSLSLVKLRNSFNHFRAQGPETKV